MEGWTGFGEGKLFLYFLYGSVEILVGLFDLFGESLENVWFDGVKEGNFSASGAGFGGNIGCEALNRKRLFFL